ncbi:MAG: alpha/beta hydrolase [Rhodomicrobium sp.]|nr:alpha/beta hydrolase [Rhodomicrobium sp.]
MKKFLGFVLLLVLIVAGAAGVYIWRQAQGVDPAILEAKYVTPADRFLDIAGVRVRVREEGPEGAPPLVLVHGFIVSLESWDGWAKALSEDYRVIRYDLRGHGLTGPDPQKRYAPVERAEFVGDVMDALGVESAYIAGNSLGGLAAWRFAAMHPERVRGLVLVSPGAYSVNGVSDAPVEAPQAMKAFLLTAPEAGIRASLGRIYGDDAKVTESRVVLMRDMMRRRGNGQAFVESIEEFTLPDPAVDLAKITAPTLILWGDGDIIIPPADGGAPRRRHQQCAAGRL